MITEGAPLASVLIPLTPIAFLSYTLLTIAVNATHYESDGEALHVYTEPLPYFRYGSKSFAMDEIERVSVERPAYASFPEGKAGFYDVYVHTLDGDKVRIAAIVNHEHAHFIAQEIEAHLRALKQAPDLALDEAADDAEPDSPEAMPHDSEQKALRS